MAEQETQKPVKLTPEQVARLDPFGTRKIPASEELTELLKESKEEDTELLASPDWNKSLINKEREALKQFFGKEIYVPSLPHEITPEKLRHWGKLGMRLHYLPPIEMSQDKNFPGWEVKPNDWFYEEVQWRRISSEVLRLPGKWILIDSRDKPDDQGFGEIYSYPDDFLSSIIEELRRSRELKRCDTPQTRAYVSWRDYHDILVPEIAKILGVEPDQVRLPRTIEFYFLTNIYYPQWRREDTAQEWFEDEYIDEEYEENRLIGDIYDIYPDAPFFPDSQVGFRPLVEF